MKIYLKYYSLLSVMVKRLMISMSWFILIMVVGCNSNQPYAYSCEDIPTKEISEIIGTTITRVTNMNDAAGETIKINGGNVCFLYSEEDFVLLMYIKWDDAEGYYQFTRESFEDSESKIIEVSPLGEKAFLSSLMGGDKIQDLNILHNGYCVQLQVEDSEERINVENLKKMGAVFVNNVDNR